MRVNIMEDYVECAGTGRGGFRMLKRTAEPFHHFCN